jgi:hypothetical protein
MTDTLTRDLSGGNVCSTSSPRVSTTTPGTPLTITGSAISARDHRGDAQPMRRRTHQKAKATRASARPRNSAVSMA